MGGWDLAIIKCSWCDKKEDGGSRKYTVSVFCNYVKHIWVCYDIARRVFGYDSYIHEIIDMNCGIYLFREKYQQFVQYKWKYFFTHFGGITATVHWNRRKMKLVIFEDS